VGTVRAWLLVALRGAAALAFAWGAVVSGRPADAESLAFVSDDAEIVMWFYAVSSANGTGSVRDRGSSFATYSFLDDNNEVQFYGGNGFDPTRRGSVLLASDTSATIPTALAPSRYQIDSLRVTVTLMGSIGDIPYDNTADDSLQLTTAGGDDPGNPIELWGVGFDGDYATFGFNGETGAEYFNSGDRRWPIAAGSFTGPYQVYAIDPEGNDVENSVFGGYSATGEGNVTEQFTPTPFAVGKAYDEQGAELAPGTMMGAGTELAFDFDLTNAGVVSYLQSSLAAGHLGLFLSSLHQPLAHTGEIAYPDYFLDNNPSGPNPNGNATKIELNVTILDDDLPGDFSGDGVVDGADLLLWQQLAGQAGDSLAADGNGDGVVDQTDLTLWRDHFGAGGASVSAVAAVPEASSAILLSVAASAFVRMQRQRRR
jgi:hypothetical protein